MNTRISRGAFACALLATTAFCGLSAQPALAQSGVTPAARPAPDGNGVDVITGELNVPLRSVSIGRPGESRLTYVSGFSDGVRQDSFILEATGGGPVAVVNIQGRVVTFTQDSAGVYVPDDADGSTFVLWGDDFIYTARDGTRIEFLNDYGDALGVGARGDRIIRPDGEQIKYYYKVAPPPPCPTDDACIDPSGLNGGIRVQAITSSLGYLLKATYAENIYTNDPAAWNSLTRVTAINSAVDFCQPSADACSAFSQAWPQLVLGHSQSGATATDTLTDNLSNSVTVTSTEDGPTSITSPASPAADVSLTYDADSRVATVVRGGGTWGYSYSDGAGRRTTTVTQPLGGSRVYVSDLGISRVLTQTDELGRTTSYQYDAAGRLTRTTAPEGNYVQRTYDARGNVTETRGVAKSGSGLGDIVTSASFAATCSNQKTCNKPVSVTDAGGNSTDFTYDPNHGGLLTATLPAPTAGAVRPQTRMSYSSLSAHYKNFQGNIVPAITPVTRLTATSTCQTLSACAGTADEVKSTIAYGSAGTANNLLPTATSTGDGTGALTATVAQTYDPFGNVLTTDGPLAGAADTVRFRYDAARRPVGTVSPDPDGAGPLKHRAQRLTYDADGQVARTESGTVDSQSDGDWAAFAALEAAETSYDALGRPVTSKLTSGATTHALTQTSYDARGRPLCTARRMNPDQYASLPASACDLGTAGAFGPDRITKAIYDSANQMTQVKVALGTVDEANEVTTTYRGNGQAETLTDGEGNRTTYTYDGHDRLSRTLFPSPARGSGTSNAADYEELTYDVRSLVTSRRMRDGKVIALGHDALGRMVSKDVPNLAFFENDVTYAYDNLGRLTNASYPGWFGITLVYDALGRKTAEVNSWFGTTLSQYDLAGRRTRLTWRDGFAVDYSYLVTGETADIKESGGFALATFGYDDRGRRTSLTRGNGTSTSYSYDPASRLSTLGQAFATPAQNLSLTFGYNPASQIVETGRSNDLFAFSGAVAADAISTVNGLNQLTVNNGAAITHDGRGNLTSDGVKTFGYTTENRLASSGASPGLSATYLAYDPLGRLHYIESSVTDFRYEGSQVIEESVAGTGALRKRFVHGPGVDEPLVAYDASGAKRWFHADERGSIVATSDASGNTASVHRYDEYGVPQDAIPDRFGYTGQMWLPEVGVYSYKARMYDPKLGRFLQSDPIGYGDGLNMYAYVSGDPVNLVDPSGTKGVNGDSICRAGDPCTINGMDRDVLDMEYGHAARDFIEALGQCVRVVACGLTRISDHNTRDTITGIMNTPGMEQRMVDAMIRSSPFGNASDKDEHGFWISVDNGRYIAGETFRGDGASIKWWHNRPEGANIFFHTHPYLIGQRYDGREITGWGFSPPDINISQGNNLLMLALSHHILPRSFLLHWMDCRGKRC